MKIIVDGNGCTWVKPGQDPHDIQAYDMVGGDESRTRESIGLAYGIVFEKAYVPKRVVDVDKIMESMFIKDVPESTRMAYVTIVRAAFEAAGIEVKS